MESSSADALLIMWILGSPEWVPRMWGCSLDVSWHLNRGCRINREPLLGSPFHMQQGPERMCSDRRLGS